MTQPAKIRLKIGSIELEYEGDPAFLKEGLESLLKTMSSLSEAMPVDESHVEADSLDGDGSTVRNANGHQVSTSTIAAHLDAKTGPELVICALASLEIIQGKSGASRDEISHQMKTATAYFKTSMISNLTSAISTLVKSKRLNEIGSNRYSLNATERKSIEAKIASI